LKVFCSVFFPLVPAFSFCFSFPLQNRAFFLGKAFLLPLFNARQLGRLFAIAAAWFLCFSSFPDKFDSKKLPGLFLKGPYRPPYSEFVRNSSLPQSA